MNLYAKAHEALMCPDPAAKIAAARALHAAWQAGVIDRGSESVPVAIPVPGRPERPVLVAPRELSQRGLGTAEGRAALVHAVAHIEFNAINLALDAVYRFRDLPDAYRDDWLQVAVDEAKHFELLAARLSRGKVECRLSFNAAAARGDAPLLLGGDHAVTLPVVRALAASASHRQRHLERTAARRKQHPRHSDYAMKSAWAARRADAAVSSAYWAGRRDLPAVAAAPVQRQMYFGPTTC